MAIRTEPVTINIGPQHPSTHGVLRLRVTFDGEVIVDIEPVFGYLHRGSEKLAEERNYVQVLTLTDRLRVEDSWPAGGTAPTDAPRLTAGRADIDRTVTVFADGTWGTGEISFELADVNQESRFGTGLELDAGGIGLIEQLETTGCTGC